jgi:hypothetical protein
MLRNTVFWDITPCSLLEVGQFSEEHTAPSSGPKNKFRKQQAERCILDSENGGSTLHRNIGQLLPDCLFRFQKVTLFTVIAMRTSDFMKIYYY